MPSKHFQNGIFQTYINLGSKTPFKDLQTDNDISAANEKIIRDAKAHIVEIIEFVESLHIESNKKINFDDYLSPSKVQLALKKHGEPTGTLS